MSAPSDSTIKGKFDEVVGNIKQGVGEAVGDQSLANKGTAEQVKGHAEQAWGSVKEGASDLKAQHEAKTADEANATRDTVAGKAEHLKDSIVAGVDNFVNKH